MPELQLATRESTTVTITLPEDTNATAAAEQSRQVQRQGHVNKGLSSSTSPTAEEWAIDPPDLRLKGAFRGTNALSLAKKLRTDFIEDNAVSVIDVTAPNKTATQPEEGAYVIDEGTVERADPRFDLLFLFELLLVEAE